MENPELGRKVLRQVTEHREQFDMGTWGYKDRACGTTACLAGWAMLLTEGYSLTEAGDFLRPDGTTVRDEGGEAQKLLGLSDDERQFATGDGGLHSLFTLDEDDAIKRFAAYVEAS